MTAQRGLLETLVWPEAHKPPALHGNPDDADTRAVAAQCLARVIPPDNREPVCVAGRHAFPRLARTGAIAVLPANGWSEATTTTTPDSESQAPPSRGDQSLTWTHWRSTPTGCASPSRLTGHTGHDDAHA